MRLPTPCAQFTSACSAESSAPAGDDGFHCCGSGLVCRFNGTNPISKQKPLPLNYSHVCVRAKFDDHSHAESEWDVVIFGGTSTGVMAAIGAANATAAPLKIALLVVGDTPVGGMTTGGLADVDTGPRTICGGFSREFFLRVGGERASQTPTTLRLLSLL